MSLLTHISMQNCHGACVTLCCILDDLTNLTTQMTTDRHIFFQLGRQTPLRNVLDRKYDHSSMHSTSYPNPFAFFLHFSLRYSSDKLSPGFQVFLFICVCSLYNCFSEAYLETQSWTACRHLINCTEGRSYPSQCCVTAIRQQVVPIRRNQNVPLGRNGRIFEKPPTAWTKIKDQRDIKAVTLSMHILEKNS